ncbi:hypothetical protein ACJRO7_003412 [Eucalyptus globulus]|uniref:Uncharacterized protein n=1 Tax=Eucalyptus globulus TaxID=34317 RepID=A0ABD3IXV7_EUCGL
MSLLDSQIQKRKRSPETSEVFDSVFGFLMDFADKAETIVPQPKRRAIDDEGATNEVGDDEQEPSENEGDGNAGELFDKLPAEGKEELLKDVLGEIVGNMLDNLPEDGKEAFLVRCFDGLFPKLPLRAQRVIECRMIAVPPQSQEASAIQSAPESSLAIPNHFPKGDLVQVGMVSVNSSKLPRRHPGRVA